MKKLRLKIRNKDKKYNIIGVLDVPGLHPAVGARLYYSLIDWIEGSLAHQLDGNLENLKTSINEID